MDVNREIKTNLTGHTIIVTGGTRGIGLGIVRVLGRAGAELMVTGRKPARLEKLSEELTAADVPHRTMQADVAKKETSEAVVAATLEAFGKIDGLVANAQSYRPVTKLEFVEESDFDLVLETGPKGTLFLMQAVLPAMRERGRGRIVTFGSSMGNTGVPGYGPYSAAKEAVRSLTRTAAREWGQYGITVNCVCPASVAHRMSTAETGSERAKAFAEMYENHPLGRDGDPEEDIAPTITFLLSDASQYLTGQTLMVDGGGIMRA
jgi:NAD(P)-dependent dehydrogenase (short-subunit alcohol dehydrogenase family)